MNLKKLFVYELILGLALTALIILSYLFYPELVRNTGIYVFITILLWVYIATIHVRHKNKSEKEVRIYNRATKISGIAAGVVAFLFIMNLNNFENLHFGHSWFYGFIIILALSRSISGLLLLKSGSSAEDKTVAKEIADLPPETPVTFLIINNTLFSLILLAGFILFAICIFWLKSGSGVLDTLVMPAILVVYIIIVCFSKAVFHKQRILDEREKHIIFKITSIAALLLVIALMLLFTLKDFSLFGYQINAIWGLILVPLCMVLWGLTGLLILTKEEGGVFDALRKE
jgi:hypothetical protein